MTEETIELVEETLTDDAIDEGTETPVVEGDGQGTGYTPSFSYKVLDEERTFDPRFHGVIKSKEDEDYLRDLYTKADGLENIKTKYSTVNNEYGSFKQQVAPVIDGFKQLKSYRDAGKYSELFRDLGVDEDAVLNHALSIARERELPEDQRKVITQNRDYERRVQELSSRLDTYESSQQEQLISGQMNELQSYVSDDSVKDIRETLAKTGQDLSTVVYNYGVGMYQTTGKEPSVKQAFEAVIGQYRAFAPRVDEKQKQPVVKQQTLPKIKGDGGMAQAMKSFSLDDLKKMASSIPN
jgi:hypothetical protein